MKELIIEAVFSSLCQLCGKGINGPLYGDDDESWHRLLRDLSRAVALCNRHNELDGKPHNWEVRSAVSLYNRCIRVEDKKGKRNNSSEGESPPPLEIISDLGLNRTVNSACELAQLLSRELEERLSDEFSDIRPNGSGLICLVGRERMDALRRAGRLPCPQCVKWCKGEKGLWWHQQREHGSEYSVATTNAASERTVLALIPYNPSQTIPFTVTLPFVAPVAAENDDVFGLVKKGDLHGLIQAIKHGFDPRTTLDRKGASALLWAAGGGHLDMVRYLVKQCSCSPDERQRGKRSFFGRTALHWAARNGHLNVVQFLVDDCSADLDATTSDGTTAFNWACWQGHLEIMKFLHHRDCDIHKLNSFGCNSVLWCAQGEGSLDTMKWLVSVGCNLRHVNSNGHGPLHKAAQRGRPDLCKWLYTKLFPEILPDIELICPDMDQCTPSDLAGMEGHVDLANWIAEKERDLVLGLKSHILRDAVSDVPSNEVIPKWLFEALQNVSNHIDPYVWEPGGGVRRMAKTWKKMEEIQ